MTRTVVLLLVALLLVACLVPRALSQTVYPSTECSGSTVTCSKQSGPPPYCCNAPLACNFVCNDPTVCGCCSDCIPSYDDNYMALVVGTIVGVPVGAVLVGIAAVYCWKARHEMQQARAQVAAVSPIASQDIIV
jgi:hypothetical protein